MKTFFLSSLLALFAFIIASPAQASEPKLLSTHGKWSAYSFMEGGNKVCYMASQPDKAEGNYTRRGDVYALITHRPSEGTKNVFSYIAGYPYKTDSSVDVKIGSRTFKLFTQDDTAWAPTQAMDDDLAVAIRKGSRMVVKGTSRRGTLTTDTFSLAGSSKAYEAITKECNL